MRGADRTVRNSRPRGHGPEPGGSPDRPAAYAEASRRSRIWKARLIDSMFPEHSGPHSGLHRRQSPPVARYCVFPAGSCQTSHVRELLRAEAASASAGVRCVGIVEDEAPSHDLVLEIHRRTLQVDMALGIADHLDAMNIPFLVGFIHM